MPRHLISDCRPVDTRGIMAVIEARIGAIILAPEMAIRKLIDLRYKTVCPFCEREEKETMQHLVFQCKAFRKARRENNLQGTFDQVEAILERRRNAVTPEDLRVFTQPSISALTEEEFGLSLLLGGSFGTTVGILDFYPTPPPQEDAESVAVPSVAESVSSSINSSIGSSDLNDDDLPSLGASDLGDGDEPQGPERPHLFRVGNFLASVRVSRARTLSRLIHAWRLQKEQTTAVDTVAHATAADQSPNG